MTQATHKSEQAGDHARAHTARVGNGNASADVQRTLGNRALSQLMRRRLVQAQLTVSHPEDIYEQEADRVADAVMRMPEPVESGAAALGATNSSERIQRLCSECEEGLQRKTPLEEEELPVQGKREGAEPEQGPARIEPYIDGLHGQGETLALATRAFFEPRFGADFGGVRIHADAEADRSAKEIDALAYTAGPHIVFRAGYYDPSSSDGRRLLAHELVHVVQQNRTGLASRSTVQRKVLEQNFPGGGRVDLVREGEHLVWSFDVGSANLKSEHEKGLNDVIKDMQDALNVDKNAEVDLEGQASSTGTDPRNETLSAQRVAAVKAALQAGGVDVGRVRTTSVGSAKSLPGSTQEEFARSRAVRVILVPRIAAPTAPSPTTRPPLKEGCPPAPVKHPFPLDLEGGDVALVDGEIRAGDEAKPGMIVSVTTKVPPIPLKCGDYSYLQNIQPFIEIVYKDDSRNRMEVSAWHLDNSDPYPCRNCAFAHDANDTPGFAVGDKAEGIIRTIEIRHEFRMFYMFNPVGGNPYTLQVGRWVWVAQARNPEPELKKGRVKLDSSISRVIPKFGHGQDTSELPVVSPQAMNVKFVTDTRLGPSSKSLAAEHLPFLNVQRPVKPPGKLCGGQSSQPC